MPSKPKRSKTAKPRGNYVVPLYEIVHVPRTPYVRPNLIVKQTLLRKGKKRLPFNGLFTLVDLPKHTFLGYYMGKFYDDVDDDDAPDYEKPPKSHYAISGSGYTVIPPGERTQAGVNPRMYPLAMMNEPPKDTQANVTVVEWREAHDAVPGERPTQLVGVLAMHTCRAVAAGEELYYFYGNSYDRRHYGRKPHNVGRGCSIRRTDVPDAERPRNAMLTRGITSVPEGLVFIRM